MKRKVNEGKKTAEIPKKRMKTAETAEPASEPPIFATSKIPEKEPYFSAGTMSATLASKRGSAIAFPKDARRTKASSQAKA